MTDEILGIFRNAWIKLAGLIEFLTLIHMEILVYMYNQVNINHFSTKCLVYVNLYLGILLSMFNYFDPNEHSFIVISCRFYYIFIIILIAYYNILLINLLVLGVW